MRTRMVKARLLPMALILLVGLATGSCSGLFPLAGPSGDVPQLPAHSEANWQRVRAALAVDGTDGVTGSSADWSWLDIPWLPSYVDGVMEADRLGKPLLLWGMNGHRRRS